MGNWIRAMCIGVALAGCVWLGSAFSDQAVDQTWVVEQVPDVGAKYAPSFSAGTSQVAQACATATSLTVPAGARWAVISVEDQNVRWRDDGTAPTAANGHLLYAGDSLVYSGPLGSFQLIQTAATAKWTATYYR